MPPVSSVPRFQTELGATLMLALPIAAAQLAQIAMGTTDTILLGSLGRDALAAGGLGGNLYWSLMLVVAGGLASVGILVAHARGAGEPGRIAVALRGGFVLAVLAAIPPMALLWQAEPLLLAIGEPPALAHAIAHYDRVLLLGMPASLLMATQRSFLASMGRPWMVMAVALVSVVLNGLLNYGLIHGAFGLPRMGYIGSATATVITLWGMTAAIGLEMRVAAGLRAFRLWGPVDWGAVGELAALGWPIALTVAVEILLFAAAALIVGMFGETALAAHQIAMTAASTTFMVPLAISQAVNVRVGFHMGAASPVAARQAAWVAYGLGLGFNGLTAATLLGLPRAIAGLYLTAGDPHRGEVIDLAVRLLIIAALFQVFDGAQTIAAGALRGLKDTRVPALAAAIGYWAIGFTTAWALGVWLSVGVVGIWCGLAVGLASAAILLSIRFWRLSEKLIRESERRRPAKLTVPAHAAVR